jgi:hypothetical protein
MEQKLHPLVLVLMLAIGVATTEDLLGRAVIFDPVVVLDNRGGHTIQVRAGQVVRKTFSPPVDPNTVTLSSDALGWSQPSDPHASHGPISQADFKALRPGVSTIKFKLADGWQGGPIYYVEDILVRDRTRPYDLALSANGMSSGFWNHSGFALRVGDEIVVASPSAMALTTDSSIILPTLRVVVGDPGGLTTFRAERAGTAQIGLHRNDGFWLPATMVVSNSASRFDLTVDELVDGTTIQLRVGQSLRVTVNSVPRHQPWIIAAQPQGVIVLLDPSSIGQDTSGTFGFQAVEPGTRDVFFRAEPMNCASQTCADETRAIHLSLHIS